MKKMIVDERLFDEFPTAKIGVIVAIGMNNSKNPKVSDFFLSETEATVISKYSGYSMSEIEEIKTWRLAYRQLGINKKYKSSIEALMSRVVKGNPLPSINPLVDFYNSISLKFVMPCGSEDLDKISGDVRLTFARGDEPFTEIGGEYQIFPDPNELIYRDDIGCLCRNWNWREADRTKITEETKNAIIVIENIMSHKQTQFHEAVDRLNDLVKNHLKAETAVHYLDAFQHEIELI